MLTPLTTEEYARHLIQRYNSMRSRESETNVLQTFLGAKDSIQDYPDYIRRAYDLAEKELFPVTPSEPTPNTDQRPTQEQASQRNRMPTPGDLFQAWKEGGKEKLAEMLPDVPDEDEE